MVLETKMALSNFSREPTMEIVIGIIAAFEEAQAQATNEYVQKRDAKASPAQEGTS